MPECEALFSRNSDRLGHCVVVVDLPHTWGPGELDPDFFYRVRLPVRKQKVEAFLKDLWDDPDDLDPNGQPRRYRRKYKVLWSAMPQRLKNKVRNGEVITVPGDVSKRQILRALRWLKDTDVNSVTRELDEERVTNPSSTEQDIEDRLLLE